MKKIYRPALAVLTLLLNMLVASCDQSELPLYDESYDGIAFYIAGNNTETDSLSYSFAYNTEQLKTDTLFIKMRLVGTLKDTERAIKVVAAEGTTAKAGVNYKLSDIVLPAGKGFINYPLILYNTPDLETNDLKIVLKIEATEDLKIGAVGRELGTSALFDGTVTTTSTTINLDHYIVKFNNKLSEPDYWTDLESYDYGSFSIAKFQFMLKTLGTETMNKANEWTYNQLLNYRIKLKNALVEYEKINGALIDENGLPVQF